MLSSICVKHTAIPSSRIWHLAVWPYRHLASCVLRLRLSYRKSAFRARTLTHKKIRALSTAVFPPQWKACLLLQKAGPCNKGRPFTRLIMFMAQGSCYQRLKPRMVSTWLLTPLDKSDIGNRAPLAMVSGSNRSPPALRMNSLTSDFRNISVSTEPGQMTFARMPWGRSSSPKA